MQELVACPCCCGRKITRKEAEHIKEDGITHTSVYKPSKIIFTYDEADELLNKCSNSQRIQKGVYMVDIYNFCDAMENYLNKHFGKEE